MAKPEKSLKKLLNQIGFYKYENSLEELRLIAMRMAHLAGRKTTRASFEALPSFIPSEHTKPKNGKTLLIDIGGTSTKVGLRTVKGGKEAWELLFEKNNNELRGKAGKGSTFERFVKKLAIAIKSKSSGPISLGLVWSNAVQNIQSVRGVSAIVTQREQYQKNEWFIKDLKDGDDLGRYFEEAFSAAGIDLTSLVISNDTVLTMKALPGAAAGVVASTGLNGSLVKTADELFANNDPTAIICNGEIGGRFLLPATVLSAADWVLDNSAKKRRRVENIELLVAGKFIPQLFAEHIVILAFLGFMPFKPIAKKLKALGLRRFQAFEARDLEQLVEGEGSTFLSTRANLDIPETAITALTELAHEIIVRAATLCALVCFSTISNQLNNADKFKIALDSRLAREIPLFFLTLSEKLNEMMPDNKKAELLLLKPLLTKKGAAISIPMQGAARALDSLKNSY